MGIGSSCSALILHPVMRSLRVKEQSHERVKYGHGAIYDICLSWSKQESWLASLCFNKMISTTLQAIGW